MDKNIGKKLDGRYEISELIGMGGMADVYKAIDIIDDKIVAVKILKNEFAENEEFLRRFRNESKAIAVLSHPNIVKVLDVGFTDKIQFIVMEYIDGITLKEYIEQEGVLRWKDCVHFTVQILRALQHAHDRGIVHRDIKPQNIMLFTDGTIKVMDFGIAKFAREVGKTITDKAIGSVHYISPEQARGDVTDDKSDIYSVGVMMYEMLTGKKPFDGDNAVSIALMHMQDEPENPGNINPNIPGGLMEIFMHAMEKDPAKRYQSAAEMIKDIERFKANPDITFGYVSYETNDVTEATQFFTPVSGAVSTEPAVSAADSDDEDSLVFEDDYYADDDFEDDTEEDDDIIDEDAEDDEDDDEEAPSLFVPILTAVAIALILAAVIFFVAYIVRYFDKDGGENNEHLMPNLVGIDIEEAEAEYTYLKINISSQEYSEYEEGIIYAQDVQENRPIKSGQIVNVNVSKGIKTVKVPDVSNLTSEAAVLTLKGMGFLTTINNREDAEVSEGYVISTEPAANTEVRPGETIVVYVSTGSEDSTARVPDLVGYDYEYAATTLEGRGFVVSKVEADSNEEEGIVIAQSVDAHDVAEKGTEIVLTVSNGIAPAASIELPIDINSKAVGSYQFTTLVEGVNTDMKQIDDITLTGGVVRVTVSGTGTKSVAVKVKNISNGQEAIIAKFNVDFTAKDYSTLEFNSNAFDEIGGIPVVTTTTTTVVTTTTTTSTTAKPQTSNNSSGDEGSTGGNGDEGSTGGNGNEGSTGGNGDEGSTGGNGNEGGTGNGNATTDSPAVSGYHYEVTTVYTTTTAR